MNHWIEWPIIGDSLLCSKSKPHGQQILSKLRADGEVWLTGRSTYGTNQRMRVIPLEEDEELICCGYPYLVLWRQRLYVFSTYGEDYSRFISPSGTVWLKDKAIFGKVVECHPRPK